MQRRERRRQQRFNLAERLEATFTEAFNRECETHQIFKFGVESTELGGSLQLIQQRRDSTSKFVRYLPDAVLVRRDPTAAGNTVLLEFKAAKTGVRRQSFFSRLKAECPDMSPPFQTKEDVFNIEAEALDNYVQLMTLGIDVIVVAYAAYRNDVPIRAQFADKIVVCNRYNPNQRGRNTGSGTINDNANFASFEPAARFFDTNLNVPSRVIDTAIREVLEADESE